jgi:hypothetical protein
MTRPDRFDDDLDGPFDDEQSPVLVRTARATELLAFVALLARPLVPPATLEDFAPHRERVRILVALLLEGPA